MAELKPCPFCGEFGDAVHFQKLFYHVSYGDTELTRWKVMCENCGAEVSEFCTPERAIEAWNRRTDNGNKTDM